jgi:hypothetical protein
LQQKFLNSCIANTNSFAFSKFFTRKISFHDKQFGCAMTMEGNKVKERQCKKEKKHDSEKRNIPSASSVIP